MSFVGHVYVGRYLSCSSYIYLNGEKHESTYMCRVCKNREIG